MEQKKIVVKRKCLMIKTVWRQTSKQLEAGFGPKNVRKSRHITSVISMTQVQLPQSVVLTFFPDLLRDSSVFYGVECQLAGDGLEAQGVWDVAALQLTSRTMNADKIVHLRET